MADPAFQAAVVLDTSRLGSQESAADRNYKQSQIKLAQEKQSRASIEKGLSELNKTMTDLKSWEDQKGFQEIMSDHKKVIDAYLGFSKGGLNITAPKSEQEINAYKAIQDAHSRIIQKVNTWDENKKQIDAINVLERTEMGKPEAERLVDWTKTYENIQSQYDKGIVDRKMNLNSLVVFKPEIGSVDKLIDDNKEYITVPMVDPVTGVPNAKQVEQQKQDLMRIYEGMDESHIEGLKKEKARAEKVNPNLAAVPLQDFFVARYSPAAKGKLSKALKEMDEEDNTKKVRFLGSEVKMMPGSHQTDPVKISDRTYTDRYEFSFPTKKLFKVPTQNGEQNTTGGWQKISVDDYAEAELQFYDPNSDKLIFRTGESSETTWLDNNTTIAIPASNLSGVNDLPIVVDGEEKKLGDVRPKEDKSKPKEVPGMEGLWSKPVYIPKKK